MDLHTLANDARHDLRALDLSRPVDLAGPGGGLPVYWAARSRDRSGGANAGLGQGGCFRLTLPLLAVS